MSSTTKMLEAGDVDRVGHVVRAALGAVLGRLPEGSRTGDTLKTQLGIDGACARRIVRACNAPSDAEVVTRSPGVKQLRNVARVADVPELEAAADALETLIKHVGKSKADLTKLIRAERDGVELHEGEALGTHALADELPAAPGAVRIQLGAQVDAHWQELVAADGVRFGWWSESVNIAQGVMSEQPWPLQLKVGETVVLDSGWLGEDRLEQSPAHWLPSGVAALDEAVAKLVEWARAKGVRVLLRPHARHLLSDSHRAEVLHAQWQEQWGGDEGGCPVGLAVDPSLMIEESMQADAEDHVQRIKDRLEAIAEIWVSENGEMISQ